MSGYRSGVLGLAAVAALLVTACGDEDPFDLSPGLREGSARIFEVAAENLPSAFDLVSERRLFLGSGDISESLGDIFLEGGTGLADLRLRSISSLLRAEATHAVELLDLGEVDFDELLEAADEGYVAAEDSTGVAAVAGHVYTLRIRRSELAPNFAKLIVDQIGAETPGRRFIDFRYVVQTEPGNRRFEEE
jgi:hypothetical protein